MAKGYNLVEQEAERQAARRQEIDEAKARQGTELWSTHIKAMPGMMVTVRFLEQGNEGPDAVNCYPRHEYQRPERQYPDRFTCLKDPDVGDPNADCPGCNAGLKISVRTVYNLIQRNRAVLRKGQDGKAMKDAAGNWMVEGFQDDVVYWECSNTTGDMLRKKDNKYGGLMSRDFELSCTGLNTNPYAIEPADIDGGPQPMSENDRALAAKKHNLNDIYKCPTVQEAAQIVAKYGANSGANSTAQGLPNAVPGAGNNPMLVNSSLPPGAAIGNTAFAAAQQGSNQE